MSDGLLHDAGNGGKAARADPPRKGAWGEMRRSIATKGVMAEYKGSSRVAWRSTPSAA